jgi:hypothetical protein
MKYLNMYKPCADLLMEHSALSFKCGSKLSEKSMMQLTNRTVMHRQQVE